MKIPILVSILVALASSLACAAELSVFRVCQDQRVIRTSDGVEAGHVEYIVVDPSSREVVSTVITGGVIGERLIALPYASLRFSSDREIMLNEITRERLVSAPVIERTQISAAAIEPSVIERTTQHFSARTSEAPERATTSGGAAATTRSQTNAEGTTRSGTNAEGTTRNGTDTRSQAETERNREGNNANRPPGASANTPEGAAPNAREDANRERPRANTETNNNPREESTTKGPQDTKAGKANPAPPKNVDENKGANTPANEATKDARDANDRTKAQNERGTKDANAQNEPQTKHERKGTADRNAAEESTTSHKPAEENATEPNSKRPPKKTPESTEEKRKEEPRSPQP